MLFMISTTIICCTRVIIGLIIANKVRHEVLLLDYLDGGTRGLKTTNYFNVEIRILG